MNRLAIATIALLAACHHDHDVKTTPSVAAVTTEPATPAPAATQQQVASPNVAVSGDLAQQCQLDVGRVESAPKFAYNEADLLPEDRAVLDKIATCVTTGPLAGKRLQLVGRADARGTEEYNLGLGSQRAAQVGQYLTRLGVADRQLARTTRGALDATGTDESSWMLDRRVDVRLM